MAELAIHDPHYFNVESDQKTAIVHLFHNPIPADGPRDEGPEWAREVDDIYLIGGVGPDGPTVKTVTNDEVTEWSAGGGSEHITRSLPIRLTDSAGFNFSNIGVISMYEDVIAPRVFGLSNGDHRNLTLIEIDGAVVMRFARLGFKVTCNGADLPVTIYTIMSNDYEVVINTSTVKENDEIILVVEA